jgi:transcriptional regulator NrdR family protein
MVSKKDGTKELYDRSKLKRAILLAFANSMVTSEEINNLLNTLEVKWLTS